MDPYDSFKIYQAVRLHFDSDSYDAVKYNFKTSAKPQSFYKRRDKFFFAKLAKKYPKNDQLVEALVANFVAGKSYARDIAQDDDSEKNVQIWKKVTESMSYNFKQDLSKLEMSHTLDELLKSVDKQHPPIIKYLVSGDIHITTVVILDQLTNFMSHANKKITETIMWPEIYKRVKKTSSFIRVDVDKFKKIIVDIFS